MRKQSRAGVTRDSSAQTIGKTDEVLAAGHARQLRASASRSHRGVLPDSLARRRRRANGRSSPVRRTPRAGPRISHRARWVPLPQPHALFGKSLRHGSADPWLASALADEAIGSRSERLTNAHDVAMEFLEGAAGSQGELMATALQRLQTTLIPELRAEREVNFDDPLDSLKVAWPQKVDRVGEAGPEHWRNRSMRQPSNALGCEARRTRTPFVVACFFFGHGFARHRHFRVGQFALKPTPAEGSAEELCGPVRTTLGRWRHQPHALLVQRKQEIGGECKQGAI